MRSHELPVLEAARLAEAPPAQLTVAERDMARRGEVLALFRAVGAVVDRGDDMKTAKNERRVGE